MSDLPFGLDPTSSISRKKLEAFATGRMNTTSKKTPFQIRKEQQDRKKKESEHEAAMAYAEFIDYYEDDNTKPKAFLKADTLDADRTKPAIKSEGKRKLWLPDNVKLPSQTKTYEPPKPPAAILGTKKSAKAPKKMSNMEIFKERIKQEQQEREARHAMKKAGTGARGVAGLITSVPLILPPPPSMFLANPPQPAKGSQDNGDPTTTNLYVGNLSPQMNEAELCRIFGRFGPLASVKIMWPRTAEEHSRGRMCGFVAFMARKDGDQCLQAVNGMEIMGHDIKLGWGKAVPLPPRPFYVHAATKEGRKIKTGLPFNAQPKPISAFGQAAAMSVMLSNDVGSATIVVVIPGDKRIRQLIHRTIEFVVREGPEFEALLIKRTAGDKKFQFLVTNTTHEHIYYRWKLFSVLQGDKVDRWSKEHFCMFEGGSTWEPPAQNQLIVTEEVEKGHLSTSDRDTLEEMLRSISPERQEIARAMVFCLNHASAAQEVVDCVAESLSILETPAMTKVARLFLVSDILHNCSAHVRNASYYRNGFEGKLPQIFLALHQTYRSFTGRLRAEQFRQHVTNCLEVWKDWNVFTPMFFKELECIFRNGTKEEPPKKIIVPVVAKKKPEPVADPNEPKPLFPDDVYDDDDDDDDDDVDGEPMEDDDDDDVDGVPLTVGAVPLQTTTFTPVAPTSAKRPVSLSKWEQDDDDDDDVMTKRVKR